MSSKESKVSLSPKGKIEQTSPAKRQRRVDEVRRRGVLDERAGRVSLVGLVLLVVAACGAGIYGSGQVVRTPEMATGQGSDFDQVNYLNALFAVTAQGDFGGFDLEEIFTLNSANQQVPVEAARTAAYMQAIHRKIAEGGIEEEKLWLSQYEQERIRELSKMNKSTEAFRNNVAIIRKSLEAYGEMCAPTVEARPAVCVDYGLFLDALPVSDGARKVIRHLTPNGQQETSSTNMNSASTYLRSSIRRRG